MGNFISCALMSTPLMKNSKTARVIFPGGEIRQFREPIKAAELMLECPNFFAVNSSALHIGRRFSALSADEELEFGNLYIMFPMKRVNSFVTAADMAVYFMAANSAAKRISSSDKVRISPESSPNEQRVVEKIERVDVNDNEDGRSRLSFDGVLEGFDQLLPEYKFRLSVCRSRKPMLETIKEEPIRSR